MFSKDCRHIKNQGLFGKWFKDCSDNRICKYCGKRNNCFLQAYTAPLSIVLIILQCVIFLSLKMSYKCHLFLLLAFVELSLAYKCNGPRVPSLSRFQFSNAKLWFNWISMLGNVNPPTHGPILEDVVKLNPRLIFSWNLETLLDCQCMGSVWSLPSERQINLSFLSQTFYPANCKSMVNLFPNRPSFLHVCSTSLLKTLGKRE